MTLYELIKRMKAARHTGDAMGMRAPGPQDASGLVPVKITGQGDGGGFYDGKIFLPPASSAEDAGDLALPETMVEADDCILINPEETGLPTHWIKTGAFQWAQCVNIDDDDGKQVLMMCDGGYYRVDSPRALTAGDGKKWHRDEETAGTTYGDDPVSCAFVTPGTGSTLNQRLLTLDAGGRCFKIGPELGSVVVGGPTVTTTAPNVHITWPDLTIVIPNSTTSTSGTEVTVKPNGVSANVSCDVWKRVTATGTHTISADDWRGRNSFHMWITFYYGTVAESQAGTAGGLSQHWKGGPYEIGKIYPAVASNVVIGTFTDPSYGDFSVYISSTNGSIVLNVTAFVSEFQVHVSANAGPKKTTNDI